MHIEIQEPKSKIKFVSISFEKSRISFPGIHKYKEVKQQLKAAMNMPTSTFKLYLGPSLPLLKYEASYQLPRTPT